jgi:hypothetical protein
MEQGDEVCIFSQVRAWKWRIQDPNFNVKGQAQKVLESGGEFFACGFHLGGDGG